MLDTQSWHVLTHVASLELERIVPFIAWPFDLTKPMGVCQMPSNWSTWIIVRAPRRGHKNGDLEVPNIDESLMHIRLPDSILNISTHAMGLWKLSRSDLIDRNNFTRRTLTHEILTTNINNYQGILLVFKVSLIECLNSMTETCKIKVNWKTSPTRPKIFTVPRPPQRPRRSQLRWLKGSKIAAVRSVCNEKMGWYHQGTTPPEN